MTLWLSFVHSVLALLLARSTDWLALRAGCTKYYWIAGRLHSSAVNVCCILRLRGRILCLVFCQATAFMQPFWSDIRQHCIDPLLRGLDQGTFMVPYEVALVAFHGSAPHSHSPVEMTGWTGEMSVIYHALAGLSFGSGGPYQCNHVGEHWLLMPCAGF